MNEIVKNYISKNGDGEIRVDLLRLAKDENFRKEVVKNIVSKVKQTPHACVLFPSYQPHCANNPLGKLINELALSLVVETLVTGDVEKIRDLRSPVTDVIIIKQSFKSGRGLHDQIMTLASKGCKVHVICLVSHSSAAIERFRQANDVDIEALVSLDEIPYVK